MSFVYKLPIAFLPETILLVTILACIVLSFVSDKIKRNSVFYVSLAGMLLSLFSYRFVPVNNEIVLLNGSFISNPFTCLFGFLILTGSIITILMSKNYTSSFGKSEGEFYCLLMTASLGGLLLVSSNDLISFFISLETVSISSYILCAYTKSDKLSNEAGLKYLIIGATASAIMLYGLSFLYGVSGNTNYEVIAKSIALTKPSFLLAISFVLILGGFLFKLGSFPFHFWVPDVYEGAPVPVAAFLSVVSKTAGLGALIVFMSVIFGYSSLWCVILGLVAAFTMTIGNIAAIKQTDIKRLMGYSSIAQCGYLLAGVSLVSIVGFSGSVFYLIAYIFTNLGAWVAIEAFISKTGKSAVEDFRGLLYKQPLTAVSLLFCFLSLAGIPLTAGFIGKFYLFKSIFFGGGYFILLLLIALINTIVGLYYYFGVIRVMFDKSAVNNVIAFKIAVNSPVLDGVCIAMMIIVFFIGIAPAPYINLVERSVSVMELNK
jgi:NAD(P)H-quinone oxidoreductase subunit 2